MGHADSGIARAQSDLDLGFSQSRLTVNDQFKRIDSTSLVLERPTYLPVTEG